MSDYHHFSMSQTARQAPERTKHVRTIGDGPMTSSHGADAPYPDDDQLYRYLSIHSGFRRALTRAGYDVEDVGSAELRRLYRATLYTMSDTSAYDFDAALRRVLATYGGVA